MPAHHRHRRHPRQRRSRLALAGRLGALACLAVLAGCATGPQSDPAAGDQAAAQADAHARALAQQQATAELPVPEDLEEDPLGAATYWRARLNANPQDRRAAVKLGEAMRALGSHAEAVSLLQPYAARFPEDQAILGELALNLTAAGKGQDAASLLSKLTQQAPQDKRLLSAYGVALDRLGDHDGARRQYDKALGVAPGDPVVLNNKALSLALTGDLPAAEDALRRAADHPKADERMVMNLAMVLALQGKFDEAERIAGRKLSAAEATKALDHWRALVAPPGRWDRLRQMEEGDGGGTKIGAAQPSGTGGPQQELRGSLLPAATGAEAQPVPQTPKAEPAGSGRSRSLPQHAGDALAPRLRLAQSTIEPDSERAPANPPTLRD